jgi:3-dehydroquinate synthase
MRNAAHSTEAVVVLCGFMGTGKSAVGEALARRLGVQFVDTDRIIEERTGMTVARIFDSNGESHFRALEAEVCRALDPSGGAVIATGGGMVMDRRNFVHLQSLGTTVLLEASHDAILERAGSVGDRPLLAPARGAGIEARRSLVASLLESRRNVYEQCDLRLDTTTRTVEEAAFDLAEMLQVRSLGGRALLPLRVDTRPIPGTAPHPGNTRLCRVVLGAGTSGQTGEWLERLGLTASAVVLAPRQLREIAGPVSSSIAGAGIPCRVVSVEDGDEHKTLAQVAGLVEELARGGAGRDTVLVSVGGGVTGDVAGFVASMYMRGLPFVQIPTTLLAQVDASIGGKVGVNHAGIKNLLGALYQPHLVLTDPGLLSTLPDHELANGMAEVIKTAIIGSADLFERLSLDTASPGERPSGPLLIDAVSECARIKGVVIERDPFERDRRRVLNLGHTIAHALESALDHGISHGEAVGLGLLAAWRVAIARGDAEAHWLDETRALLDNFGLPVEVPEVDASRVRAAIGLDKKRRAGRLTFVLPIRPGHVTIVDDVSEDDLLGALSD